MTTTVKKDDLLAGGRMSYTRDGAEITRTWLIEVTSASGAARFMCAIASAADIGEEHPYVDNVFLASFNCRCEDSSPTYIVVEGVYRGGAAQNAVTYSASASASAWTGSSGNVTTLEIAASLRQVQTNRDVDGNQITVTYNGDTQGATVSKMVPNVVVSYRQVEAKPPDVHCVGKVNSSAWSPPGTAIAGSARQWLCTNIQANCNAPGMYHCNYAFELNTGGGGWDAEVAWTDPKTGKPAASASAVATVQIYSAVNFNSVPLGGILG